MINSTILIIIIILCVVCISIYDKVEIITEDKQDIKYNNVELSEEYYEEKEKEQNDKN